MYKKKQTILTAQMNSHYSDFIPSLDTIVVHKVRCLGQAQKCLHYTGFRSGIVYNY